MRPTVLALALLGCATAPTLPEGAELQALTPAQLEEAFEGRAACFVDPKDGACGTIVIAESTTPAVRVMREVSATDIARFIDAPMAQFVRSCRCFSSTRTCSLGWKHSVREATSDT